MFHIFILNQLFQFLDLLILLYCSILFCFGLTCCPNFGEYYMQNYAKKLFQGNVFYLFQPTIALGGFLQRLFGGEFLIIVAMGND